MFACTDQMGRRVMLPVWPPKRIISLVPSQTELLDELGLSESVVGITKFCVHPVEWFRHKAHIGGTKTIQPEKVFALKPDLVLGNKEENDRDQIEVLAQHFPVWMSDIKNLDHALEMIGAVGELTGKAARAGLLQQKINLAFEELQQHFPEKVPGVAYLIWRKPFMVAAADTFIDDMLRRAGFRNVFSDKIRYPEITPEELELRQPQALFLSSEPFPFQEKHIPSLLEICPDAHAIVVDGTLFSWYGSRLQFAPAYFHELRKRLDLDLI